MRSVAMAALTTILGMVPLLADAFFVAMAVATLLTLLVVPVLYTIVCPDPVRRRDSEVAR